MASLIITPEHQIQRLNVTLTKVNELRALDSSQLITAPNPKAWSVLEIIEHLNIAYQLYVAKIDTALAHLPSIENADTTFEVRWWQGFVIESPSLKLVQRLGPLYRSICPNVLNFYLRISNVICYKLKKRFRQVKRLEFVSKSVLLWQ